MSKDKKTNKKPKKVTWERVEELHSMVWKFGDEIKELQNALQEQIELHKEKNELIVKLIDNYLEVLKENNK